VEGKKKRHYIKVAVSGKEGIGANLAAQKKNRSLHIRKGKGGTLLVPLIPTKKETSSTAREEKENAIHLGEKEKNRDVQGEGRSPFCLSPARGKREEGSRTCEQVGKEEGRATMFSIRERESRAPHDERRGGVA